MDHATARERASARADGELGGRRAHALDSHLASCASCRSFASRLPRLRALALALPRERAPERLVPELARRLALSRPGVPGRARTWRLAPAFAAVLAVTLFAVLVQPLTRFALPAAEASEALARIHTLFAEREVTLFADDRAVRAVTRERIWFRAPGSVRIERDIREGSRRRRELEIHRPGERYTERFGERELVTSVAPSFDALPEPLSAAVALIGTDTGPGPEIAGRPTRRIEASLGAERRVAFVDAQRFTALGIDEDVVLGKSSFREGALVQRKRTLTVRYNEPIAAAMFAIPPDAGRAVALDFEEKPPSELAIRPRALPEGFRLVRSGRSLGAEQVLLYARGSLLLLVHSGETRGVRARGVSIDGRPGSLFLDLYAPPAVRFPLRDEQVTIQALLPPDALVALASKMFPRGLE